MTCSDCVRPRFSRIRSLLKPCYPATVVIVVPLRGPFSPHSHHLALYPEVHYRSIQMSQCRCRRCQADRSGRTCSVLAVSMPSRRRAFFHLYVQAGCLQPVAPDQLWKCYGHWLPAIWVCSVYCTLNKLELNQL